MRIIVTEYLDEQGIKRSYAGFHYLRTAIMECIKDPVLMLQTYSLYKHVASIHNTTITKVERAIRYSISKTPKPCKNGEYIALAADTIAIQIAQHPKTIVLLEDAVSH